MYLVFLDGSGNTGADLTHPTITIHYLLALMIPGESARSLEDEVSDVLVNWFGREVCNAPGFECKGSDMYRGEGPCATMPAADRVELYERLIELIPRHNVDICWQGIDKPRLADRYVRPMHPHKLAFLYAVEAIERFLRSQQDYGLLISDEEKSVEQQVIEDLPRYKELGTAFGYRPLDVTRIVDNVHWVRSHNSRLLQLADNCTYLCQRFIRDQHKTTRQAQAIQRLWGIVDPQVWRGRVWP
jgi:hypothetical protein